MWHSQLHRGAVPLVHSQVRFMALYGVTPSVNGNVTTLKVGFEDPASNDEIVVEAKLILEALELEGRICKITGPASLPVAMVLCHHLAHRFAVIACYDPKMQSFVVSVSHDAEYPVGSTL